jgi:hypothetical protein
MTAPFHIFSNSSTELFLIFCAIYANDKTQEIERNFLLWILAVYVFWIDNRIYWALRYSAWLSFTIHHYTHTHTYTSIYSHVFTRCCPVTASNTDVFPFLLVPEISPASGTSYSHQLTTTEPQHFCNSLTNLVTHQISQLRSLSLTVLLIRAQHGSHRKHRSSVSDCGPLPSKSRCQVLFRCCYVTTGLHATICLRYYGSQIQISMCYS